MPGATDDGREHGTRSIISSEAGLAHTGTIVHDQSLHVTVRHLGEKEERERKREKSKEVVESSRVERAESGMKNERVDITCSVGVACVAVCSGDSVVVSIACIVVVEFRRLSTNRVADLFCCFSVLLSRCLLITLIASPRSVLLVVCMLYQIAVFSSQACLLVVMGCDRIAAVSRDDAMR